MYLKNRNINDTQDGNLLRLKSTVYDMSEGTSIYEITFVVELNSARPSGFG